MMSVEKARSGRAARSRPTSSMYSARVWRRRIRFSSESDPDCTGRWKYEQSLGSDAKRSTRPGARSQGFDVVKRTRSMPATPATRANSSWKGGSAVFFTP